MTGRVYLVGAGPGDPKLLTLRGKELLERADIVFYDALANPALLKWTRPDAEKVHVGKRGGQAYMKQEQLNERLIQAAREGKCAVRLKGGDPFLFGRGGEEAETLRQAGIPVEIAPGISSAYAAPAYAGIPLTSRQYGSSVAIVTGHEDPTKDSPSVHWEKLAGAVDTVAVLMGMGNLKRIAERLLAGGRPADTPAAAIQWGTRPEQKTVAATLGTIAQETRKAGVGSPAVLIVGEVARLRERLRWFDNRPLFGRTVIVTRARAQASSLAELLEEAGARTIECPSIRAEPLKGEPLKQLDAAAAELDRFDWALFSSANAVGAFWERLEAAGRDARAFGTCRAAAIGPATARSLRERGVAPDLVPRESRSEGLLNELLALPEMQEPRGKRFLLLRSLKGRQTLREGLLQAGAEVTDAPAYQTAADSENAEEAAERIAQGAVDVVTFTSGSTVANFLEALPAEDPAALLQNTTVAAIGPVTRAAAEARGLKVAVQAEEATVESLAEAVVNRFAE